MSLGFRAAGATAAGGISLTVNQPLSNLVQVGDLIVWAVAAAENTRGWGAGINNTGSVPSFNDLSTAAIASVWNGRSQYLQDDGASPRWWLWIGYRIATVADTGGVTYTASLNSSPAFGVGIASAYAVYSLPNALSPIFSLDANRQNGSAASTSWTAPTTTNPAGNTGTFTFTVSTTNAAWKAAQTTCVLGDVGDAHVVCLCFGRGGSGVWNEPASLTGRVRWGGLGGPWYMLTWADGPTLSNPNLGRLPLLGAG